jgi:hypothetical protein
MCADFPHRRARLGGPGGPGARPVGARKSPPGRGFPGPRGAGGEKYLGIGARFAYAFGPGGPPRLGRGKEAFGTMTAQLICSACFTLAAMAWLVTFFA